MTACETCLRTSVLRSEGLVLAERRCSNTAEAARLLRMPPEQMLERLRGSFPALESELAASIEALQRRVAAEPDGWVVCQHDPAYPQRLTCFQQPTDVPAVLYGVGSCALLTAPAAGGSVAIVGARRASAYGREVAYSLAREAADSGLVVVSGMALGVDGAAHRGALQATGRTIAVLAGAAEIAYPRSHRLLHEQIRSAGCIVSEHPPGSQARRWAFVARNRLIAGLAQMTVFVEGTEESGARHTVSFAEELGRSVGAVPGPVTGPMSSGPNALLAENAAAVIRNVEDVLDELGLGRGNRTLGAFAGAELPPLEHDILELIAAGDRAPRALCASLPRRTVREVTQALGALELRGRVRRTSSGEYELATRA